MDFTTSIVLLSGGLDSVVNLYWAHKEGKVVRALTFDYGQKSRLQEIRASKRFCELLSISHEVIELPWFKFLVKTSLVNEEAAIPTLKNLDDIHEARDTAKAVWVPNRNGLFLNIGACYAEALGAEFVIPGFNKEEASTFPDNSPGFIESMTHAFQMSTMTGVRVACFTSGYTKIDMVQKAKEFKIDFKNLWSCYENAEVPCGRCESCLRSQRAFAACGVL